MDVLWCSFDSDSLLSVTACCVFNYFTNWLINYNWLIFSDLANDDATLRSWTVMYADTATTSYNLSATVNDKITLPCRTTPGNTVSWFFHRSPDSVLDEIYVRGAMVERWTSHLMIGSLQAGDHNLVILSALTTDTGLYYCIKDDQNETVVFINLTILTGICFSTRFSSLSF